MGLKQFATVFGIVFLLIGVLGFVPGVTDDEDMLLGIFQVSAVHNIIHLLSGVAALIGARSDAYAKLYFQVFGVVYAVVTAAGFIQSDTVLGIIDVNMADNLLHLAIAVAALALGFGNFGKKAESSEKEA